MFDKLIDILIQFGVHLCPVFVVFPYEKAVVLQLGKLRRVCGSGWHFKIPVVDVVLKECIVTATYNAPFQSLTTKDGFGVVVSAILKYRIVDVAKYLLEYDSPQSVMSDILMCEVKKVLMSKLWTEGLTDNTDNEVSIAVRRELKKMGIDVDCVYLSDHGKIRSIRLLQDAWGK